jgi:hypothetical protein
LQELKEGALESASKLYDMYYLTILVRVENYGTKTLIKLARKQPSVAATREFQFHYKKI